MAPVRRTRGKTSGTSGELTTDLSGLLSEEEDDAEGFETFHIPTGKGSHADASKDNVDDDSPKRLPRRSVRLSTSNGANMRRASSQSSLIAAPMSPAMTSMGSRKALPGSPKRAHSTPRLDKRHTIAGPPGSPTQSVTTPPSRIPGDVSVCVRLRPPLRNETCCLFAETANCVRLKPLLPCSKDDIYWCDTAFGPTSTQEQVYDDAVAPICESVLEGYNGAVIAYGQTGSGKTYTIIGDTVNEVNRGIIPRAVGLVFESLQQRKHWSVEVSVLEIYNERCRDLLTAGVTLLDIHEVTNPPGSSDGVPSFHCPDATMRDVRSTEDALKSLFEGLRRRETSRTDMNHSSSRSHLIFTLTTTQSDDALKATLRGRLHLVDLAGCERLKRSMGGGYCDDKTSRERDTQRREAGAINKSLTQLALVIFRLTQPAGIKHVPYRDSILTRLLADSFGGSSKTCLIINCSPAMKDREETRGALEFGKRANLVKNVAEINIEMSEEPSEIVKALVAKELAEFRREREEMRGRTREAALEAVNQQRRRLEDVRTLEQEKSQLEFRLKSFETAQASADQAICALQDRNQALRRMLETMVEEATREKDEKIALQKHLRHLLRSSRDASAPGAAWQDARALVEESPPQSPPRDPRGTNGIVWEDGATGDVAGASTADSPGATAQRSSRLYNLEEELRGLESRWADVLEQSPPAPNAGDSEQEPPRSRREDDQCVLAETNGTADVVANGETPE